ncbi:gamma-interferon-responsive lysosomal thiol protein-like [Lotus japonicus]|uniref:Gamma-interferon-inducible lysosomal thiol reductase n=1 Tax=Lotus japonicus TaxID=34305 RepID=I3SDV9_LOTJA|nr:gamma-interferon-responsive lysosomal thiol protein-like [Lotus japonicus]AFK38451.1 unknown [Lotus japonicus]
MGPPKLATNIVTALVLLSYSSGSHIDGAKPKTPLPAATYQKVNLSVYYESLSKPCVTFIVNNLREIFNNRLIKIVNLQLVPWANAHFNSTTNSITCQNGPDECERSSYEACALNTFPTVDQQYRLISCFENPPIEPNCFEVLGLSKEPILKCLINSGNGTELGKKYIKEIAQLNPPPSFVPWVLVNNQPIKQDYANFTHYVCKTYKGVDVPAVCSSV